MNKIWIKSVHPDAGLWKAGTGTSLMGWIKFLCAEANISLQNSNPQTKHPTYPLFLTFPRASFSCFSAVACFTFASRTILWASCWDSVHVRVGSASQVSHIAIIFHYSPHREPTQSSQACIIHTYTHSKEKRVSQHLYEWQWRHRRGRKRCETEIEMK